MTVPRPHDRVTLLLAGDVMTGRGVDQILPHPGDPELRERYMRDARSYVELAEHVHGAIDAPVPPSYVWMEVLSILDEHEPAAAIANLETSITTSDDFWPDKAVHYRMHPDNIDCLRVAGFDVCTLANNHSLDFGRAGLLETLEVLRRAGIATAGAGRSLDEAVRPARIPLDGGGALLVFSFGSATSGIPNAWAAGADRSGVALLPDLSEATASAIGAHVRTHKRPGDLALVSIHWGSNWGYELPAEQVTFAHELIHGAVDVVHGHSSHHVRPIEVHDRKLILYGCGDLVTDYEGIRGYEAWRGDLGALYLVELDRRDGALLGLRLLPTQMNRLKLSRARPADDEWLTRTLNRISKPLGSAFALTNDGSIVLRPQAWSARAQPEGIR